jgi:hypothetical protein
MLFFSEKTGEVCRDGIQHIDQFFTGSVIMNDSEVFIETAAPYLPHAFSQPRTHQFFFSIMKIDAATLVDQFTETSEVVI